jgi:hypothetical protein
MLWRDMRGRTRRKSTNELQDLDPNGSPHSVDWWKCRSRSPISFPSRLSKNHGRGRGESKASRSTMEERENHGCFLP